jgi:hypothetical protein
VSPRKRDRDKPKHAHRRQIRIGVVLPATVELIVGTDDEDPSADSDWEILEVVNAHCETTPRMVGENMHEADSKALADAAANAEDLP